MGKNVCRVCRVHHEVILLSDLMSISMVPAGRLHHMKNKIVRLMNSDSTLLWIVFAHFDVFIVITYTVCSGVYDRDIGS